MTWRAAGGGTYAISVQDALPHVVHTHVAVHRRRNYFCTDCSHARDGIWLVQREKRELGQRTRGAWGGAKKENERRTRGVRHDVSGSVLARPQVPYSHLRPASFATRHAGQALRLRAVTLRSSLPPIMRVLSWAKSRELTFMPNPFK
jgi:hypothetical protein